MRNSPRSSLEASRCTEEPASCAMMFALGTRAPVASCTVPRREPREFWAWRVDVSRQANNVRNNAIWCGWFFISDRSEIRLRSRATTRGRRDGPCLMAFLSLWEGQPRPRIAMLLR